MAKRNKFYDTVFLVNVPDGSSAAVAIQTAKSKAKKAYLDLEAAIDKLSELV